MQKKPSAQAKDDPRQIALQIVYGVLEKGGYANILLTKYLSQAELKSDDRHLVTEIVNGTIRMLKHLDWVLNLFLRRPVEKQNPWLRNVLRISLYQMLFMARIPEYAIVNSAVEMAREKAGAQLAAVANGVLRNLARHRHTIRYPDKEDQVKYLSVYYSMPEWLVTQWLSEYEPPSLMIMLDYFNRRPNLCLRSNQLINSRAELLESLAEEGVLARASTRTPWGLIITDLPKGLEELTAYNEGRFYIQNEASLLVAVILDPQPGEKVIDLGCGVGGKTTFMAELMNNSGQIDAFDLFGHKVNLLRDNCERLGITIVQGHEQDVLTIPDRQPEASKVLLDAPCSGLGVLHRRSDLRWKKTPADLGELQELQWRLLDKAAQMTAAGGRLVYSTCTINRAENEALVMRFIKQNPHFVLESFADDIKFFPLDEKDKELAQAGMLTLIPGKYDTDGMFYARMKRSAKE